MPDADNLGRRGFLGGLGGLLSLFRAPSGGYSPHNATLSTLKVGKLRKFTPPHYSLPLPTIRAKVRKKVDGLSTFGVSIYVDPSGVYPS